MLCYSIAKDKMADRKRNNPNRGTVQNWKETTLFFPTFSKFFKGNPIETYVQFSNHG